jgi:VanZ family protein
MNNYWFKIATISTIFAVGNIVFRHFEQETPKWRRVTKVFVFTGFGVLPSARFGRTGF